MKLAHILFVIVCIVVVYIVNLQLPSTRELLKPHPLNLEAQWIFTLGNHSNAAYVYKPILIEVIRNRTVEPLPCRGLHDVTGNAIHVETNSYLSDSSVIVFTTFVPNPNRFAIHSNTIRNWAQYRPVVQPVLFNDSTDPELIALAVREGWDVLALPPTPKSEAPRLKYMYTVIGMLYPNATFIGLANGDILFDVGLLKSLDFILQFQPVFNKIMVIGGRYNMYNTLNYSIVDSSHVHDLITQNALNPNKLTPFAQDYFFIYRNQFPWAAINDSVVIGRMGVDNYFVTIAMENHVTVVDASCTVGALHQMDELGLRSGRSKENADYNLNIIDDEFPYGTGTLDNCVYHTGVGDTGEILMNVDNVFTTAVDNVTKV